MEKNKIYAIQIGQIVKVMEEEIVQHGPIKTFEIVDIVNSNSDTLTVVTNFGEFHIDSDVWNHLKSGSSAHVHIGGEYYFIYLVLDKFIEHIEKYFECQEKKLEDGIRDATSMLNDFRYRYNDFRNWVFDETH